jgi:hypothetical protein
MDTCALPAMDLHKSLQAARNNALWCDAVCRAHDTPGVWTDGVWFNRHAVPRFYPNAVTLRPDQGHALGAVLDQLPAHCAIKDSFHDLSLADAGFHVLFKACWLWRSAAGPALASMHPGMRWERVSSEEQLNRWEEAWGGTVDAAQERIFLQALLADRNIAFLAAWQDEQIRAGVIANQGGGVVGLSNLFARDCDAAAAWAGAVMAIGTLFPVQGVVGYESGDDLALAQSAGFGPIGFLRAWVR